MSKRIEEMLAKSKNVRSVNDVRADEVAINPIPRTAPIRAGMLERLVFESELPLDKLMMVAGRKRHLSAEQYAELKANLEHNPLTSPITVRRATDDRYEIIAGHNRVQIFKELGREKIKSVVLEMTDDEADKSAFYSNLLSVELSDYEKFIGLQARIKSRGLTQEQVAEEAGISQSLVSLLLAFAKLPTAALSVLATAADKDILGSSVASKLAKLAQNGKEARVVEAVQKMANGEISQAAAVAAVESEAAKSKPTEPIPIRSGKKIFCTMRRTERDVRLSFPETISDALIADIQAVLERHAKPENRES